MKFLQWMLPVLLLATGCNTDPDVTAPSSFGIYIYPNPATEYVNISLTLGIETSVEVIDSNCELFFKGTVGSDGYFIVDIANHSSGIFHVIVTTSRETLTREFIKL